MKYNPALMLAGVLALVLAWGCDFGEQGPPDPDPARQTEIIRVEVVPNPVAAGDTALFRAVIEDSLSERFEYRWFRSEGYFAEVGDQFGVVITDTNSIYWVAPDRSGAYRPSVQIDNGSQDSTAVGQSFDVTVVTPSNRLASQRKPYPLD